MNYEQSQNFYSWIMRPYFVCKISLGGEQHSGFFSEIKTSWVVIRQAENEDPL